MEDPVTPLAVAALLWAAAALCFAPPAIAAGPAPVVVELFTSQGCNSCPPADALLGELAGRDHVLPLSFHVTYWDRLGWPDSFGLAASTRRQQAYADRLGRRGLYTPQMVIGGRLDAVGSQRHRVLAAIELLQGHDEPGPALAVTDGELRLGTGDQGPCTLWLIGFDRVHDVAIERGENRGRTLRYHNVVREIVDLGTWQGDSLALPLPLGRLAAERRDAAVLVQRQADGAILGARRIALEPG
ncbi:MAG: hypothetical protein K0S35_1391 [Geminicoccaceae bacterium]|nr:hypothetical protein [Geminicoccaceae bacterium]